MSITPAQENERMLARMLGVGEEQAAMRLNQSVTITAEGQEGKKFAQELKAQLERTVQVREAGKSADLEIVIGTAALGLAKKTLFVEITSDAVTISRSRLGNATTDLHGVQRILAACYAASVAFGELIDDLPQAPPADPFVVSFSALGALREILAHPIALRDTALVGAGAVGNAFLRAARHLDISGDMTVCDPKAVGSGNPNRCLYFSEQDIDKDKATRLCTNAQNDFPNLKLIPFTGTFADFRKTQERGRVKRVIIGADSRLVRRSIERELPLEVIDASTTGATEVIVHSHGQPNPHACLGCIYPPIPDELGRARDIASGLGVPLATVTSGELIDEATAAHITAKHQGLDAKALVGKAFDSLFKQLCAEQALLSPTGEQVLAPFAFVSSLAGALQALELARFDSGARAADGKNYLFASAWSPPHARLRRLRGALTNCDVCGDGTYGQVLKAVWSDRLSV